MDAVAESQEGTRAIIEDFLEDARDTLEDMDELLLSFDASESPTEILSALFTRVHSLVSILRLGGFTSAADFGQELAATLNAMRHDTIPTTELVRDVVLFSVQHLQSSVEKIRNGQPLDVIRLRKMREGIRRVIETTGDALAASAALKILAQGISTEETPQEKLSELPSETLAKHRANELPIDVRRVTDLAFFHDLMVRMEIRYPDMAHRGQRLLKISAAMNEFAHHPIDPQQLKAAVYLHDFGMMFLGTDPWRRVEKLTEDDRRALHEHPMLGAELLWRVGGWDAAVSIILQHHERIDGTGYPERVSGETICPGAQILAIADAAYAMTHVQHYRECPRPLIKAVAEINNCAGTQFAREWVEIFNRLVHQSRGRLILGE